MRLEYFEDTDTLYIALSDGVSDESEEIAPGLVAGFDADGRIVGLELDSASRLTNAREALTNLKTLSLSTPRARRATG